MRVRSVQKQGRLKFGRAGCHRAPRQQGPETGPREGKSMDFPKTGYGRAALVTVSLLALAGCEGKSFNDLDFDMRGLTGGFTTADAARGAQPAAKPQADARGVISYPTYQVAVAREGESIAEMAGRLGLGPNELGRYNGIPPQTKLRAGEIIALPRRVDGASATPTAAGTIDVTSLAAGALDRVGGSPAASTAAFESAPVRHQVQRGETAYSIARLYNVSVRALSDWNSLDSALSVREGQYLLIPVATAGDQVASAGAVATTALDTPAAAAPSPAAAAPAPAAAPAASATRMMLPADGSITRPFQKGKTDGIEISAAAGSPVRAAADGTVAAITRDTDQVPILVIRHAGNVLTVYAGIDAIAVKKGDTVTRGQVIAKVRAGNPAFLHFQVREGTMSVDPMGYLN